MSATPAQPSRPGLWLLTGAALVLVYFLSAPIVWNWAYVRYIIRVESTRFYLDDANLVELAAHYYATPYYWLDSQTPLRPLTSAYDAWWFAH